MNAAAQPVRTRARPLAAAGLVVLLVLKLPVLCARVIDARRSLRARP